MPAERGPCRSEYTRYAYQPDQRRCIGFTYGGCRGNLNNFLNFEDCMNTCREVSAVNRNFSELPVDCVLSDWTSWSPCSVSCGIGRSDKYRNIVRQAENGGQPCPEKRIVKRRRCYAPLCQ